ncbi:Holliday junction branch migration protein RuvA [Candidatus Falkowbacteria bacterium CG10_big_fil_rev_8_21_14_0_10_37_14]|uniref:Holliday junction branch migration complex subunit RuvA n=1 Tax=Candidatus Falkowbacteria bacterium CG10_big_fil_rev_8_21_14_0_10_37_14 TaxID=1974561 RepID=A0A2M6WSY4_9BACT|nr:Holliday junction branch migration protein RuvA [Candidatus Falkowbacteria bacterium]PIT95875.1 MAG: Holliday junction branch migration protein RuvA [Candidatus Falkowbacteria bacterium CG10_big_fil_rev_8_21_14_0_10_37_14]
MLAFIKGKIIEKRLGFVIVLTAGLGYKINIGTDLSSTLAIGEEAEIYLYHQVKEDGVALYGFAKLEELEFFELLISVSGVGPRSGLNILSSARMNDLKSAIASGDSVPLVKVSGIGKKTAERLIVELKNKMDVIYDSVGGVVAGSEELEALMGLGYSAIEARNALQKTEVNASPSDRLRQALQYL